MKKIIALLAVVACLCATASAERYLRFANVVDLEWDSDCVSADDGLGNLWEFYGCDEFFVADLIVMVIDDNGTAEYIFDDSVIDAFRITIDEAYEIIKNFKNIF